MVGFLRRFLPFFFPSASSGDEDRTVYLATAPNELVARLWQDILRCEGIIALVKLEKGAVGQPYIPAFAEFHQLHVLESQLEHAKEVLEPFVEER